jgi:predicted ATP-binding protein involved in virulence
MKLKRVSVKGLNNKVDCDFEFHDDINIVTGINGCGKTTFLKMLWYSISGNIERLISEISFKSFNLETSHFSLSLICKYKNDINKFIEWIYLDNNIEQSGLIDDTGEYNPAELGIEHLNSLIIDNKAASLFFPTFRRIEGGYSTINPRTVGRSVNMANPFSNKFPITSNILQNTSIRDELEKFSNRLSIDKHKFICSISTHDLALLLKSRHAQISEEINEYSLELNKSLINKIESIKSDIHNNKEESLDILSKLQQEAANVNDKHDELLQPFTVLSKLVISVLKYKEGIKLDGFNIGGGTFNAIDSSSLSAGEQQMLSFLCYNAFYEDSIIFIDEPEISLHVDWQRRLFPNLMKQQSSNQFIVATHSPCIYSKYPDKEIILSEEKGE